MSSIMTFEKVEQIKNDTPNIRLLDEAFNAEYNITREQLCDSCRAKRISLLRSLYICMVSEIAPILTTIELGALVNRTHATALWHLRHFNDWLKYDKVFKEMHDRISNKYKQLKKEKENGLD